MDVRKKNTYEVLDMIEKNLISESDIIYYIENDYLDNQLLEDVMDSMFSEASIKDWFLHPLDTAAKSARQRYAEKGESLKNNEELEQMRQNAYNKFVGKKETPKQTETKVEAPKQEAPKASEPKTEPVKTEAPKSEAAPKQEAPKQTETKVETNNNGHTETPKTSNDEHAEGIWEKIKSGYNSIKHSAGEHLAHAKQYAMEHPGIAGAAAAGAAVAGLAAYAGYKHLKNKKALASAHEGAHKAAMDSISKTHGHLAGAATAHIHNDIRNVINSNREMFKKDPRKSREQLVNHFGSDEYKKHLISKLSK